MIEKILGLFTDYPDKTGKDLSAENLNEITYTINALIDMILPMFEKLGLISDWVVEHGITNGIHWEKWNSGKLVQWGYTPSGSYTFPASANWGSLYTTGTPYVPPQTYAIPFIEVPVLTFSFIKESGGNFFLMQSGTGENAATTTHTTAWEIARGDRANGPIVGYVGWEAKGRWK